MLILDNKAIALTSAQRFGIYSSISITKWNCFSHICRTLYFLTINSHYAWWVNFIKRATLLL